jgi:hypothetical protein
MKSMRNHLTSKKLKNSYRISHSRTHCPIKCHLEQCNLLKYNSKDKYHQPWPNYLLLNKTLTMTDSNLKPNKLNINKLMLKNKNNIWMALQYKLNQLWVILHLLIKTNRIIVKDINQLILYLLTVVMTMKIGTISFKSTKLLSRYHCWIIYPSWAQTLTHRRAIRYH